MPNIAPCSRDLYLRPIAGPLGRHMVAGHPVPTVTGEAQVEEAPTADPQTNLAQDHKVLVLLNHLEVNIQVSFSSYTTDALIMKL